MNLAALAIEKRTVTYFVVFLFVLGGIGAFFSLGQLEDPEFTVKTAVITTIYPGASPEEVELEVTDRIELSIQEMPQVDYIESFSRAGMSLISVELKAEYWSDRLPQVWDEMRRKIRNIEHMLPLGAGRPEISDDFGDVFGFQLAVVGDGFSYADLEDYAKDIKKEYRNIKKGCIKGKINSEYIEIEIGVDPEFRFGSFLEKRKPRGIKQKKILKR